MEARIRDDQGAGPVTVVLGASMRTDRYSNMAVQRLREHGHPVIAVGARPGVIGDTTVLTELPDGGSVDTVTLYVGNAILEGWKDRILALRPRRIIFNPGTEEATFAAQAEDLGIEVVEGCTLVMLTTSSY
jgi:uncharacterized protein